MKHKMPFFESQRLKITAAARRGLGFLAASVWCVTASAVDQQIHFSPGTGVVEAKVLVVGEEVGDGARVYFSACHWAPRKSVDECRRLGLAEGNTLEDLIRSYNQAKETAAIMPYMKWACRGLAVGLGVGTGGGLVVGALIGSGTLMSCGWLFEFDDQAANRVRDVLGQVVRDGKILAKGGTTEAKINIIRSESEFDQFVAALGRMISPSPPAMDIVAP